MKRTNYIQKILSYCLIWFVFWGSFLLPIPKENIFSAEGGPLIEITTPEANASINSKTVVINGKISSDTTPSDQLTLKVFEIVNEVDPSLDITKEGTLTQSKDFSEWTFSKDFTEGTHTISFVVEDANKNTSTKTLTFTVKEPILPLGKEAGVTEQTTLTTNELTTTLADVQTAPRPYVTSIELMAYDKAPEVNQPPQDDENLAVETDDEPSVQNYLPAEDLTQVRLNSQIRLTIKESGELNYTDLLFVISSAEGEYNGHNNVPLKIISKERDAEYYYITLAPVEAWSARTTYYVSVNPAITNGEGLGIITKSLKFTTRPLKHSVDLHGGFGNNTNSCASCHSTHNGTNDKLVSGPMGNDPTGALCMSCHDGSNGPITDSYNASDEHYKSHEVSKEEGYSCASCHNPHTNWTVDDPSTTNFNEANPNKIKDHTNNSYKKSLGMTTDFTLCIRCHDGNKASNIKQYYEDQDLLASSGHNITTTEGSSLNGQMPCSDCHETHGSSNDYSLKENLGHLIKNPNGKFTQESNDVGNNLSVNDERNFCLKCHNSSVDKTIDMYGKQALYNGMSVSHQDETKACSFCHGSGDNKLQSAAHAPIKGSSLLAD